MSRNDTRDGTASTAEVLATLRASGWTDEDIEAVPRLNALLDKEDTP